MRQYVAVILVKSDGSVLAQHRDNKEGILGPDSWGTVGGAREEGEALEEAAVRELMEETDYKVNLNDLVFLVRDTYITEKGTEVERNIFYAIYDGVQEIHTNEGQEIRFIRQSEFSDLNIYPGHEKFFKLASERIHGSRVENPIL